MARTSKEKNREYQRKWWKANREVQIARVAANEAAKRAWMKEYKANLSCEECGFDHPAALDFHHRDPATKTATIASVYLNWSIERTLKEIAKCEVLCANCHRIRHYGEQE